MIPKSFRARFLIGFLACAGLLGYAFYVQFQLGVMPCNFCILQRIAFAALGTVFLIGGVIAPKSTSARKWLAVLAVIPAVAGAGVALRHVWVQIYPPPMAGCGSPMTFMLEMMPVQSVLRKVLTASGDCSNINWTFLGLTMPAWCALWFIGLGIWAIAAGWRRSDRKFTARSLK
ncbi:disulfide bond formation protein B [Solilutibacter silvestris]|uniref:Disulfide bond formation protein B n=1 Tax=Solilutibacter silvestris TaxID=1645665 RepID=A0A2K1PXT8_9GAMM|nr:disulfide bond formation protein B [Lysobacter silvestris]PNS07604.1 Disulfide bond formation protein DsbB [Lysobacter silvestris]